MADVPGLRDQCFDEIERLVAAAGTGTVLIEALRLRPLLVEVVRLREERDKAQRQIEKARWLVGDPVAYEDDEPVYADVDLPALADVLATEDGQT